MKELGSIIKDTLDNIADGILFLDNDYKIIFANKIALQLFEQKEHNIIGRGCHELFQASSEASLKKTPSFSCPCADVFETGKPTSVTYTHIFPDGTEKIFDIAASPIRNEEGDVIQVLEILRDITEKKSAENLLSANEEEFRLIFENATDAIFWAETKTGLIIKCNKAAETLLEKKREEIIGQHQKTIHPPQKSEYYSGMFKEHIARKGAVDEEAEVITKSGGVKPVHITASLTSIGGKQIIQGIFRNITDRKKIEETLRGSEEKFRNLAEKSPNMIFINKGGRVVYVNKKCEEIIGYTKEEYYADNFDFMVLIAPESRDLVKENFKRHMKGEEVKPYKYKLITKEKKILNAIHTTKLINYEGERAILGIVTDMTELKEAEEEIKRKNIELNAFINSIPDMAWFKDINSNFVIVNKAFGNAVGMDPEYLINNTCEICFGKEAAKKFKEDDQKVIKNRKRVVFEESIVDTEGNKILLETIKSPIFDESGKVIGTIGVARNINERKQAEEALKSAIAGTREEKAKSDAIVASIGDALSIVDTDFKITYQNQIGKNLLGDHIGEYCYKAYAQEKQVCEGCPVYISMKDGEIHTTERRKTTDRGLMYLEITSSPLKDSTRKIIGGIEVLRDITERKKTEETISRYGEHLRILREIDHAILTTQSMEKIVRIALERIMEIVPVSRVSLALFDFDTDQVTVFAAQTSGKTKLGTGTRFPIKEFGIAEELLKGKIYVCEDTSKIPELPPVIKKLKAEGMRSYINIPLFYLDELIGSLNLGKGTPGAFASEDVAIANEIADLLAVAIQQVRSQEELKISEEKYRDLYDNAPDMYHSLDNNGIILDCNKTWIKMLGYKKEEIIGRHITDFYTKKSKNRFEKFFPKLIKEKTQLNVEREFIRKDGTVFPAVLSIFAELDENGELIRTRAIARDITETKLVEDSLSRTVYRLGILHRIGHALLSARPMKETIQKALEEIRKFAPPCLCASVVFYDIKANHKEVFAVSTDCKTQVAEGMQFPLENFETVISLNCGEVNIVDDIKTIPNLSKLDTLMIADGVRSYINVPIMDLDELIGILCLASDKPNGFSAEYIEVAREIADLFAILIQRQRDNDTLRESERNYRDLVDNSLVGVYRSNLKGDILYVNKALSELLEYKSPEKMMKTQVPLRYKNPKDRDILIENLKRTGVVDNFEVQILTKTGKTKNALVHARLDGEIISGMIMDITKQRRAEETIKASEVFLASILEGIQDGVVVLDRDFKILFTNSSYIKQTMSPSGEIKGMHCFEVAYNRDEPCFLDGLECSVKKVFETGISSRAVRKKRDRYMEMTVYPLKDFSGKVISVVEIRRDVTKQVQLDEELKRKIRELEEFYEMAVGRELKMRQLKEEIFELKEGLKKEKA